MDIISIMFYVFSGILVLSSILVITVKNPVYAALALVLAFGNASALWLLQGAEFLAISLILVYVGAVMVLFLFVVMMLDLNIEKMRKGMMVYLPFALAVAGIVVSELGAVYYHGFQSPQFSAANAALKDISSIKALSVLIYKQYGFALELAGMLLLLALIAAVALTLRRRKNVQAQDPVAQAKVRREDRIRIVKVAGVDLQNASQDSNVAKEG